LDGESWLPEEPRASGLGFARTIIGGREDYPAQEVLAVLVATPSTGPEGTLRLPHATYLACDPILPTATDPPPLASYDPCVDHPLSFTSRWAATLSTTFYPLYNEHPGNRVPRSPPRAPRQINRKPPHTLCSPTHLHTRSLFTHPLTHTLCSPTHPPTHPPCMNTPASHCHCFLPLTR
jgi:hypothetical protein